MSVNKRVGRPKKSAVAKVTKGKRNSVGRPKGDASIINDYKARMLASIIHFNIKKKDITKKFGSVYCPNDLKEN